MEEDEAEDMFDEVRILVMMLQCMLTNIIVNDG